MSNNLVKAYKDGSGSSGTPIHSPQSCWMSRWTQAPTKQQGVLVAPHSQTFSRKEGLDHKQKRLRTSLNISSDFTRSYGVLRNNTKAETVGLNMGSLTNMENTFIRTPMDPSSSYVAKSPSSPHEKADSNLQLLSNHNSYVSNHAVNPGKITVFNGHFSNNDFGSLDQGSGKQEKYSAIVVHERSSFRPLLSNNHFEDLQISCQADASSLRPMRNVETMRICTAVNSVGNSHGRPPLYSKTTTHHVLFTSRTGVGHESTQHRGVKIQPLWSSTDSEKDNFGDTETPRCERSFDLSAETDTMDVVALSNKNDNSGMLFRPIDESTTARDKTLLTSSADPREDKVRGKLSVAETPGTNSLDGVEPSTSRTQSLEAEHLLSCAEQPSESKPFPHYDECALQEEPSCRWVKRLKLSSSEIEESSSHEKTHMIKESSIPSQNVVPMINGESSLRMKKKLIFQSSWIQRWCQDRNPSKSFVVCEPDTSKLPLDELEKKQFPSIAAVALMGKSVDGFHACKFTKRGPLVVWNSEDY